MPSLGDLIDDLMVGSVRMVVRYGCTLRDQYELSTAQPFCAEVEAQLTALGTRRGAALLYTIDVPGVHQLTVAPQRGRLVIMPRLSVERSAQRAAALAVAELIAEAARARD